jgi:hypothetical protein
MEHTRFIGWDICKERISVAVAQSGRSGGIAKIESTPPCPLSRLFIKFWRRRGTRNGSFREACKAIDCFTDTVLKLSRALSQN